MSTCHYEHSPAIPLALGRTCQWFCSMQAKDDSVNSDLLITSARTRFPAGKLLMLASRTRAASATITATSSAAQALDIREFGVRDGIKAILVVLNAQAV